MGTSVTVTFPWGHSFLGPWHHLSLSFCSDSPGPQFGETLSLLGLGQKAVL